MIMADVGCWPRTKEQVEKIMNNKYILFSPRVFYFISIYIHNVKNACGSKAITLLSLSLPSKKCQPREQNDVHRNEVTSNQI